MPYLHCDVETRSAIPIADCGSHRYINDASFSLLLLSYAIDDGDVKTVTAKKLANDYEKGGLNATIYGVMNSDDEYTALYIVK